MEVPFLRITVEDQSGSEEELRFEGVVYFMNEGKGIKESHRFIYEGGEGTFLIPLTTSPLVELFGRHPEHDAGLYQQQPARKADLPEAGV